LSDFHIVYHTVIPNEFLHLYITGLINWKSTPSEHAAIPVSMMKGKNLFVLSLAHWIENKIMVGNTFITNSNHSSNFKSTKRVKEIDKIGTYTKIMNLPILQCWKNLYLKAGITVLQNLNFVKICDIIYCFFF